MNKYFPYLIGISAIFVSIMAGYFSISGLSKLFSGSMVPVAILAISLEFAKLVSVIALHRYWIALSRSVKYFIFLMTFVLVVITSMGVYGFLAHAYQVTATADQVEQQQIDLVKLKLDQFNSRLTDARTEKKQLDATLVDLRKSLTINNQTQTVDRKTGQVLTTVSAVSRNQTATEATAASQRIHALAELIAKNADSVYIYQQKIVEIKANSAVSSEIGPLKFLAGLTGWKMDTVANMLILLLTLVIDPFAIMMLIAAQYAFSHNLTTPQTKPVEPTPEVPQDATTSPTSDDLQQQVETPEAVVESPPKRTRKPRTPKPEIVEDVHFNVDIDPIADPAGVLIDRTVTETTLTPEVASSMLKKLSNKRNKK